MSELKVSEYYNHAKEMYIAELSTLSQRTNFFLITQSAFIGALAFAFKNYFPYLFPYLISVLVMGGVTFSFITYKSGKESSESLMRWRLYLKSIEHDDGPWRSHYKLYDEKHQKIEDNIIDNTPLPYMWLMFPGLFTVIWFFISMYIPARLWFDPSFMKVENISWFRPMVCVISILVVLYSIAMIWYLIKKYCEWKNEKYESRAKQEVKEN